MVIIFFCYFKRLGAWHYKTNRDFYDLHKSCFFKFGCTFIVVIIQVLCNKNYRCPKNRRPEFDSSFLNERNTQNSIELKEKPKNQKRVSIQDQTQTHENIICGPPQSYPSSIFERSTVPTACYTCTPHNQSSTVPTACYTGTPHNQSSTVFPSFNFQTHQQNSTEPPSFKLHTCQKSTPIPKSSSIQKNPAHSTLKKNQIETKIDVHNYPSTESDIKCDETFHSLC